MPCLANMTELQLKKYVIKQTATVDFHSGKKGEVLVANQT